LEVEGEDVALLNVDAVVHSRDLNRLLGPLQHERLDIDRGDVGAEALGDRDRRSADPASNVEHPGLCTDRRPFQQLLRCEPTAGMDHALPDHRHEGVRIQPLNGGRL